MNVKLHLTAVLLSFSSYGCNQAPAHQTFITAERQDVHTLEKSSYDWQGFFEPSINKRLDIANLPQLKDKSLSETELEVRIWIGFGIGRLRAVILHKTAQNQALYLAPPYKPDNKVEETVALASPRSGWEKLWRRFEEDKIFNLPDSTELNVDQSPDGQYAVVEVKQGSEYRTYMYPVAMNSEVKEVKLIEDFCDYVSEEFDIFLVGHPKAASKSRNKNKESRFKQKF